MRFLLILTLSLLLQGANVAAQDIRWVKQRIAALCGLQMQGRGYYKDGRNRAAGYIERQFRDMGLLGLGPDSSYSQPFSFPVNTFPAQMSLTIGKKEIIPGENFLIDARSSGGMSNRLPVTTLDFSSKKTRAKAKDTAGFVKLVANGNRAYLLRHADSAAKTLGASRRDLMALLPRGAYLLPQKEKLIWTVATDTVPGTIFYVADTALPRRSKRISYEVSQKFLPQAPSRNVMAYVPGTVQPDSFIVFTAHYDHLGRMGHEAVFPGASDNASGTAMLLLLANYYAKNPQPYSIAFIAFAGEEAGLKGSRYFVSHPMIPLERIRFLTNIDIMGDATAGITVVNATEYPRQFSLLQSINEKEGFLPEIKSRGKAANSDHYFFSEAGVPSFFIYSNSGPGYYHDVFDKPNTLPLGNFMKVSELLKTYTEKLMTQGL